MANITYTVQKGDNLTKIARNYNTTVKSIVELNNIKDPNLIYVGQVLTISGTATPTTSTTNTMAAPIITGFGLVSNSEFRLFVGWDWDQEHTKEYKVQWFWSWGDGYAPYEEHVTSNFYDTFEPPEFYHSDPDLHVTVYVIPISETYKDAKGNEVSYWTAKTSTKKTYWYSADAPSGTPSAPNVTIKDYTLTAELDNLSNSVTKVEFQVIKDNSDSIFNTGIANVVANHVSYSCTVDPGSTYKVRCRYGNNTNKYGEWSAWSTGSGTKPSASSGITTCRANSETSVYLEWEAVANADSYEIEHATKKTYFDGSNSTTTVSNIKFTHYEVTGLESGNEYFFRVRAVNTNGESAWSDIVSVVIGTTPSAPTTWASTTTLTIGKTLTLYWVHNSEDGSPQSSAEIELTINGGTIVQTVNTASEDEDEKTMHYAIDTTGFMAGATILWRVRTAGVTGTYGRWSVQRTVTVYAPPTLSLNITNSSGSVISSLTSFPFYIRGVAGPVEQKPISYHVSIYSNSYYETVDQLGNKKVVIAGEVIYSKHFDTSDVLTLELSAGSIDLENNIVYTVNATVSMNSGLTASTERTFTVAWEDVEYTPNAKISVNRENLTVNIGPYCKDSDGNLIDGVLLSVYRREYDGRFTEIATGLDNMKGTFVTDPHPSLDYARYRIVAITKSTGAVGYLDIPGHYVGETAVVIQWNENWSTYEPLEYPLMEPSWSGSLLRLPYNIDISDDKTPDVSLVKYIGRQQQVSYYGTQIEERQSWSVDIPKNDRSTLYALRRLASWLGDVYVREPSGTGYWATVTVSYSQKHCETTIPVKINVTRVAGGA